MAWILAFLVDVVFAIAVFVGAFWLSGYISRYIKSLSHQYSHVDATLFGFLGNIVRWVIMAFALVFVLAEFGVQTASMIAVIGAAGLAIGLALQGTLSNLAAGVMLVVFRPIKVGQFVEVGDGRMGTVYEINLFSTELTTPDNLQMIVPNSRVFNSTIINYSAHNTRRIDLVFGVGYGADLKKAEAIIRAKIADDERLLDHPEPLVKVANLGESSVDFTVRVWTDTGVFFPTKADLIRAVKDGFDEGKIEIPFPSRTVYQAK